MTNDILVLGVYLTDKENYAPSILAELQNHMHPRSQGTRVEAQDCCGPTLSPECVL